MRLEKASSPTKAAKRSRIGAPMLCRRASSHLAGSSAAIRTSLAGQDESRVTTSCSVLQRAVNPSTSKARSDQQSARCTQRSDKGVGKGWAAKYVHDCSATDVCKERSLHVPSSLSGKPMFPAAPIVAGCPAGSASSWYTGCIRGGARWRKQDTKRGTHALPDYQVPDREPREM